MTAAASALKGESVVRTGEVGLGGWDWPRPDLPIPLPPLAPSVSAFRRWIIGLREPAFDRAYRVTWWWAIAGLLLLVAARTVVIAKFAPFVSAVVMAICGYVVVRVVSLVVFQRQQGPFELRWLTAHSEALRTHTFDVVRFTLRPDRALASAGGVRKQVLDLADPRDVGRLIRQQAADRTGNGSSRADIEFAYWPESGERAVVERVRRELKDVVLHLIEGTTQVRVRFPEARYGSRPADPQDQRGLSARTTYWFLGGPVRLTATIADRSTAEETQLPGSALPGLGG